MRQNSLYCPSIPCVQNRFTLRKIFLLKRPTGPQCATSLCAQCAAPYRGPYGACRDALMLRALSPRPTSHRRCRNIDNRQQRTRSQMPSLSQVNIFCSSRFYMHHICHLALAGAPLLMCTFFERLPKSRRSPMRCVVSRSFLARSCSRPGLHLKHRSDRNPPPPL